eukprot:gene2525-2920_t
MHQIDRYYVYYNDYFNEFLVCYPQQMCVAESSMLRSPQPKVCNGYTPEDRLEGLHFEAGGFHAAIIQVAYDNFYTGAAASDPCTMFSDAVLIKRRNIGSEVKARASACKQFFVLEKSDQKQIIYNLGTRVVDKHILQKEKMQILLAKTKVASIKETLTPDGRYLCRHPGCLKSFKFDGKSRIDHESSHGMTHQKAESSRPNCGSDDMYNYQAMVVAVINMHLKHFTQKAAFNLEWNRFFKSNNGIGGNITLDLAMEHYDLLLKNIVCMLGSNITDKRILDRYCKSLVVNKTLIDTWDKTCELMRKSGKHVLRSTNKDLIKVVKCLMEHHALQERNGRVLKGYHGMKASLIKDIDISSLFKWIDGHKSKLFIIK